jgi:hypothetical protein
MRRNLLYHIFVNFLVNGTTFGKGTEHKICVLILYNVYQKRFLFSEEFSELFSQMCLRLRVKYSIFFSDFNDTRIFSTDLRKILKYQIS